MAPSRLPAKSCACISTGRSCHILSSQSSDDKGFAANPASLVQLLVGQDAAQLICDSCKTFYNDSGKSGGYHTAAKISVVPLVLKVWQEEEGWEETTDEASKMRPVRDIAALTLTLQVRFFPTMVSSLTTALPAFLQTMHAIQCSSQASALRSKAFSFLSLLESVEKCGQAK